MPIGDVVQGLAAGVGVALSPDGQAAYYVEWSIGELSKVETSTGKVTTLRTGLSYPEDVEVDWTTGEAFVSERTGAIKRAWPGEVPTVIAEPGGAPQQLALVKLSGKRVLFAVCHDSGKLVAIDLATKTITTIATGLKRPIGLAVDAKKKVAYVTEQGTASLTKVTLAGVKTVLYTGLVSPFFLAWDKTGKAIFCVQRDPANSLVKLKLGTPVTSQSVSTGLAWRPSGVAPNASDTRIYVCADQKLQVVSFDGVPVIASGPAPFEVHSIRFNFPDSGAITLKDHVSGALVPLPEFVKGTQNGPAAYSIGSRPKLRVVLRKLPGYTPGTYAIGATGNFGGVRRRYLTPVFNPAGFSKPITFELTWPLSGTVGKPALSLEWWARKAPGPSVPAVVGAANHQLYLTVGQPAGPWQAEKPWIGALEVACEWAAGAATTDMAAAGITKGLNSCPWLFYTPATIYGWVSYNLSAFLADLKKGTKFALNCTDCADAVVTLSNLLGCDLWEGRMLGLTTTPILGIGGNPAVSTDWVVWSWSYHEIAWLHAIGASQYVYDGCLQLDQDTNYNDSVHLPVLPVKMKFSDYRSLLVASGPCTLENIPRRRPVV